MTGEMSSPVDREEWNLHAAIADAFKGELRPFDVYQGPYVLIKHKNGGNFKLWIVPSNECPEDIFHVYDEFSETKSEEILAHTDCVLEMTVLAAANLTGLNPDDFKEPPKMTRKDFWETMRKNYHLKNGEWVSTDYETYDEMLCCLPPEAMGTSGSFLVGEPWSYNDAGDHVFAAFKELKDDSDQCTYFAKYMTLKEFNVEFNVDKIKTRLEYLRQQIVAGCISYGEVHELQTLVNEIDPGDTVLLEWAGKAEFPEDEE